MAKVRWGIIGPGSIANNFADALVTCYSGELKGIASRSKDRLKNFGKHTKPQLKLLNWLVVKSRHYKVPAQLVLGGTGPKNLAKNPEINTRFFKCFSYIFPENIAC